MVFPGGVETRLKPTLAADHTHKIITHQPPRHQIKFNLDPRPEPGGTTRRVKEDYDKCAAKPDTSPTACKTTSAQSRPVARAGVVNELALTLAREGQQEVARIEDLPREHVEFVHLGWCVRVYVHRPSTNHSPTHKRGERDETSAISRRHAKASRLQEQRGPMQSG